MAKDKSTIIAPCDGQIIDLKEVADLVFSKKLMGDGFAIIPSGDDFVVPISGEMVTVFETKHAYGIKSEIAEVLIHIGLDTVNLGGEGFESFVKPGDIVSQGDKMCKVDIASVSTKAPSMHTPIIITNNAPFEIIKTGTVKAGEVIAKLK